MTAEIDIPEYYRLTCLELNGSPIQELPQPAVSGDSDLLQVLVEPIHASYEFSRREELVITGAELREMEALSRYDHLQLVVDPCSGTGLSSGEVRLGVALLEKIRRKQPRRRSL
jgi:hypothetical protein